MRNLLKTFILLLLICMIPVGTAEAAKISKKKITLKPNQVEVLSVTGTTKKIKWTSSNKKIATVSKYGIVTAKKAGKTTITAKCGKKKYKCKVTVESSDKDNSNSTIGQKNAIQKAQSYLRTQAFSYEGLIKQLEFEQYSHEEAVYAADNCGADWFEQSLKKAKSYLNSQAFSYEGLKKQLIFEKFTEEQALYGVENCEADWFEQATKKAASYLSNMSFSRDGLIKQLEFDGFTNEQAVYGVDQNGYTENASVSGEGKVEEPANISKPLPTSEELLKELKQKNSFLFEIQAFNEETDPNGSLGRPNQYISKADFSDSRVEQLGEYLCGGTIETFLTKEDCQGRADYLKTMSDPSMGVFGVNQYIYQYDRVLFRVDYDLTPEQAEEYHKQMTEIISKYE